MKSIGSIFFAFIYLSLEIMAGGYILSSIWNNFISQIFLSLPHLTFYQALAVSLVVGLFTSSSNKLFDKDDEIPDWQKAVNLMNPFLRYGFALLMAMRLKTHLG